MTKQPIRVMIVDDHALFRRGLQMVLEAEEGIDVVAEAGDGGEAISKAEDAMPDVVLMDVRMPGMDGAEFLSRFARIQPHTARVMLSGQADLEGVKRAINQAHIHYYVAKPWNAYELRCMLNQALDQTAMLQENERHASLLAQKLDEPSTDVIGAKDNDIGGKMTRSMEPAELGTRWMSSR